MATLVDFTLETTNIILNFLGVVFELLDVFKLLLFKLFGSSLKLFVSSLKLLNLLLSVLKLLIKHF